MTFEFWFDIEGPGDHRTGSPIERTLAPGASLSGTLNQTIRGSAQPGAYTHTCNVGAFPIADDSDSFDWTKSFLRHSSEVVVSWSTDTEILAQLDGRAYATAPVDIPGTHVLQAVYPNPFNPEATFRFAVNTRQTVRAYLIDVLGRVVATLFEGSVAGGEMQTIRIDGAGSPSGIYVVRLVGKTFNDARSVTLMK